MQGFENRHVLYLVLSHVLSNFYTTSFNRDVTVTTSAVNALGVARVYAPLWRR